MNPRAGVADPLDAPVSYRPRPATIAPMLGAAPLARPPVRRCGAPSCTPAGTPCRWPLDRGRCSAHQDADPTKRCRHRLRPPRGRKRGDRCLAWPLKGSALCRTHTPALIEQRRERARELAGQRQAAETRERKLVALKPVRAALALFLELLDAELERPGTGGRVLATYLRTVQP